MRLLAIKSLLNFKKMLFFVIGYAKIVKSVIYFMKEGENDRGR